MCACQSGGEREIAREPGTPPGFDPCQREGDKEIALVIAGVVIETALVLVDCVCACMRVSVFIHVCDTAISKSSNDRTNKSIVC